MRCWLTSSWLQGNTCRIIWRLNSNWYFGLLLGLKFLPSFIFINLNQNVVASFQFLHHHHHESFLIIQIYYSEERVSRIWMEREGYLAGWINNAWWRSSIRFTQQIIVFCLYQCIQAMSHSDTHYIRFGFAVLVIIIVRMTAIIKFCMPFDRTFQHLFEELYKFSLIIIVFFVLDMFSIAAIHNAIRFIGGVILA